MRLAAISPPTDAVPDADGQEKSIRPVRTVQDVRAAMERVAHDPGAFRGLLRSLEWRATGKVAEAWIWGERGLCIVSVHDYPYGEDYAWVEYLQNDPGVPLRPLFEEVLVPWVKSHGLHVVSGATPRSPDAFARLTGLRVAGVILSRRI